MEYFAGNNATLHYCHQDYRVSMECRTVLVGENGKPPRLSSFVRNPVNWGERRKKGKSGK